MMKPGNPASAEKLQNDGAGITANTIYSSTTVYSGAVSLTIL